MNEKHKKHKKRENIRVWRSMYLLKREDLPVWLNHGKLQHCDGWWNKNGSWAWSILYVWPAKWHLSWFLFSFFFSPFFPPLFFLSLPGRYPWQFCKSSVRMGRKRNGEISLQIEAKSTAGNRLSAILTSEWYYAPDNICA